jgi:hypothetical protein
LAAGDLPSLSKDLGFHGLPAEQALNLAQSALQGAVIRCWDDLSL